MAGEASAAPPRKLPALTDLTTAFWTGGAAGELLIQRCTTCTRYVHPPLPLCPACRTETLVPTPVSGKGRVATYTVNAHAWHDREAEPFVFAAVELDEQPQLHVFSNIVAPPEDVAIGQRVTVFFEQIDNVWLPLFAPEATHAA